MYLIFSHFSCNNSREEFSLFARHLTEIGQKWAENEEN